MGDKGNRGRLGACACCVLRHLSLAWELCGMSIHYIVTGEFVSLQERLDLVTVLAVCLMFRLPQRLDRVSWTPPWTEKTFGAEYKQQHRPGSALLIIERNSFLGHSLAKLLWSLY